jgi:D-threo-aldose 1-dehydrogenase
VVAAGVFNSGILATDNPQPGAHYNYAPAPDDVLSKAQAIQAVCAEHGYSLPQVAAQFPLLHPAIAVVCLGARNGSQAQRNGELFDQQIPRDFYSHLADEGFINTELMAY